ncbi:MAG: hypothetical protein WAM91_11350 [Candidatus Acidiferrales bacterium]
MFKRVIGIFAAVILVAGAALANDPWKDKDFANWDEKDVQKILQDSPWSHKIQYGMNTGGRMEGNLTVTRPTDNSGMSSGASGETTTGSRTARNTPVEGMPSAGSETIFVVSWFSSSTIREALARHRELAGASADETRKGLDTVSDTYQIMVQSQNMRAFARSTEDELKAQAFIVLKDTKAKIAPSRVAIQRTQTGQPAVLFFIFDKKTATGEPPFAPDEKGVDFTFQAGKTALKVSFDFKQMQNKQGLDL